MTGGGGATAASAGDGTAVLALCFGQGCVWLLVCGLRTSLKQVIPLVAVEVPVPPLLVQTDTDLSDSSQVCVSSTGKRSSFYAIAHSLQCCQSGDSAKLDLLIIRSFAGRNLLILDEIMSFAVTDPRSSSGRIAREGLLGKDWYLFVDGDRIPNWMCGCCCCL